MDDPRDRAELDEQAAAHERSEAMDLYGTAANLATTAENLRKMGFGAAADPLDTTADWAAKAGATDMAQSQLLNDAAQHWRETADDLDMQSKAAGGAFVAGATYQAAEDMLHHSGSDADRMQYEATAAAAAGGQKALEHQATEFGQEAGHDASTAIADEVKARELEK